MRQWSLSKDDKAEAVELYNSGLSIGIVAEKFGVSRQSMWDVLKRRTVLRDRVCAIPRKPKTAIREKRNRTLRRYRERGGRITRAQIKAIKDRDKVCVKCGEIGEQIDHIVPVALNGKTIMNNLQLLCCPCHKVKSRADRIAILGKAALQARQEIGLR